MTFNSMCFHLITVWASILEISIIYSTVCQLCCVECQTNFYYSNREHWGFYTDSQVLFQVFDLFLFKGCQMFLILNEEVECSRDYSEMINRDCGMFCYWLWKRELLNRAGRGWQDLVELLVRSLVWNQKTKKKPETASINQDLFGKARCLTYLPFVMRKERYSKTASVKRYLHSQHSSGFDPHVSADGRKDTS